MSDMVEITLSGLRFHARVGILAHERELAQPIEMDLAVRHSGGPDFVLDYRAIYQTAASVMAEEPIEYLESIAGRVADALLALEGVRWCRAAVRKPHVALAGPLAFAQVAVERTRD